ncbi:YwbE family protein [Aminivibrio sp.]|uniref:YwbE family protein n=1 Tax=Aminivibrio sp. TaxID=1872489 RepID=UPI001A4C1C93|nr:YwbE family protein [Aminivibrio sp.]MBL3538058.1 YwbE family protein [Aminivibrio sp.]
MPGRTRANIAPGMKVKVVKKEDQGTGKLTEGIVESLLTKSPRHPRGIKVRLVGGEVGRVREISEE